MIKLINIPASWEPGGLWFVFDKEQQPFIVPWLKSRIYEVENVQHRNHYRQQWTKAALKEKYGRSIYARSTKGMGTFTIYTCFGEWRVGNRGTAACMMEGLKLDIMNDLNGFIQHSMPREIQATPLETVLAQVTQSSGIAILP